MSGQTEENHELVAHPDWNQISPEYNHRTVPPGFVLLQHSTPAVVTGKISQQIPITSASYASHRTSILFLISVQPHAWHGNPVRVGKASKRLLHCSHHPSCEQSTLFRIPTLTNWNAGGYNEEDWLGKDTNSSFFPPAELVLRKTGAMGVQCSTLHGASIRPGSLYFRISKLKQLSVYQPVPTDILNEIHPYISNVKIYLQVNTHLTCQ
jgi:hypothetical protein